MTNTMIKFTVSCYIPGQQNIGEEDNLSAAEAQMLVAELQARAEEWIEIHPKEVAKLMKPNKKTKMSNRQSRSRIVGFDSLQYMGAPVGARRGIAAIVNTENYASVIREPAEVSGGWTLNTSAVPFSDSTQPVQAHASRVTAQAEQERRDQERLMALMERFRERSG